MARWQDLYQQLAHARYPSLVAYATTLAGEAAAGAELVDAALVGVLGRRRRLASLDEAEHAVRRAIVSRFLRDAAAAADLDAPPAHHATGPQHAPEADPFAPPKSPGDVAETTTGAHPEAAPANPYAPPQALNPYAPDAPAGARTDLTGAPDQTAEAAAAVAAAPAQATDPATAPATATAVATATQPTPASALSTLPPRTRAATVLRCYDDLTTAQIADRLATTPAATRELLDDARARLRPLGWDVPDQADSDGSLETATVSVGAHGKGW